MQKTCEPAAEISDLRLASHIGVNCALPLIKAAPSPNAHSKIMMPLSLALAVRCDACLRTQGPSQGADQEAMLFQSSNKPVFFSLKEVDEALKA